MPPTGTDPALTEARVGMMRVGGSRLGYVLPLTVVTIDGSTVTSSVRIDGTTIRDILNSTPNTATIRVSGISPSEGDTVALTFGTGYVLFRGRILSTTQVYEGKPTNVAWDCNCISDEWLLNRRKVTKRYTNLSATAIVQDIIARYTSGFSAAGVGVLYALPVLDEITFTNEDVTTCLDRICQRIGEDWQLDYQPTPVIHIPAGRGMTANTITDSADHGMSGIAVTTDLSQVRTRQSGEGGGSNASVPVAVGDTTIPVGEIGWYGTVTAGGIVKSGPQFIPYTGVSLLNGTGSTVAGVPQSPSAPSAAVVAGTSGNLSVGAYQYKAGFVLPEGVSEVSSASSAATIVTVTAPSAPSGSVVAGTSGTLGVGTFQLKATYETAAGETLTSSAGSATVTNVTAPGAIGSASGTTGGNIPSGTQHSWYVTYLTAAGETTKSTDVTFTLGGSDTAVSLTSIPTSSDGRVTGRKIYREDVGDGGSANAKHVGTISDNSTTTFTDTLDGAGRGERAPDVNTSGSGQITWTIPTSSDARVTKRSLYRTEAGGSIYKFLTTVSDNSTTTFVDNRSDASLGAEPPTVDTSGSGQISVTGIPIGPTGTTARRLYRTEADGTTYKFLTTISGNVTTSFTDNVRDSSLGENAPTTSSIGSAAGATSLRVADLALHPASGWADVADQVIRWTGRSASSGEGTLTGIPATGTGSIGVGLAAGVAVVNHPHLTGVTGVIYEIPQGDPINVWVERNDTAAQTFMAAAVGGDGIHEADPIQDRRLSETELIARCDATLDLLADPLVTVRYLTRDMSTRSGQTVTITLGAPTNISGTFLIQSATITRFHGRNDQTLAAATLHGTNFYYPQREVECSSRRLSFEHILRLLKASTHGD